MIIQTTLRAATLALLPLATVASAQDAPAPVTDASDFAAMAASGNMFEIRSSELALDMSDNADLQAFAQQMIDDHTAAGEIMMTAATEDGIEVPAGMTDGHTAMLEDLQGAEGAFDEAYLDAQVTAHDEAIALFSGFSTQGEQSALQTFAADTLPTLQMHREMLGDM